ncbi:MAG TPA: glycerate dehydrogenase [Lachnospiraceae bacterium]|nr:glycerate dehydrogenase [Lachnospiraceae bacterium]
MKTVILEKKVVDPGDVSWEPVTRLCETVVYDHCHEEDKFEKIADADIVLTNKVIIDEEVFERCPKVKYVGVCATGYNVVDLSAARKHGVVVTNVPAYSTASVVQHTFALLLDIASKITVYDNSVKKGDWINSEDFCYYKEYPVELEGKTLGIYGFGNIGRGVAKAAQAFGMNVLVHTANPDKYLSYINKQLRFADANSLFAYSDIISFHCPLTDETKGLVCAENIAKMKDGVVIINVSRGPIVNEKDLANALKSGKAAAAGIDVIATEPMLPDNPLMDAPNVYITPHIAWASREARMRLINIVAGNIEAWMNGDPVNVVS